MKCLLDSHTLIWWWNADPALSPAARAIMADRTNTIFVSAATAWELATKFRSGRLPSVGRRLDAFDAVIRDDGFHHLDVRHEHGLRGGLLESEHRDPFDRLLAAQALIEGLTVLTRDRAFVGFGCETLW
ncbi:type II toxin-antitoxin system VapC family toxin [Sphingomonas cannabina]|uniref:type II toxin-antitoxin system VapC family toxin n=1 Tax=Sphingomonas cannabina TaxID=2899123 RepID=UPI001F4814B1|nr:type II toxin-antitoxin system VapC family toxin [Sphingomonas cannabina]UIJ44634.1 type II toxin-antitoxin system VapC family toxin [Sphingomonas cannabina]